MKGGIGQVEGRDAGTAQWDQAGVFGHAARLVGDGQRVLIFGREGTAASLAHTLAAQNCQVLAVEVEGRRAPERASEEGRFDVIVMAGLLGRLDDPGAILRALKEEIRPGGSLIVTIDGIAQVGGRSLIDAGGPMGAGSGIEFSDEGLFGLLEGADYVIGRIERIGIERETAAEAPSRGGPWIIHDCLIVAYPLPLPGFEHLQRRIRELALRGRDAAHEAEGLRRQIALAEHRLGIMAGHEQKMAGRIKDLRAHLLDAHAQMIRRDDEIRKTFGDAIYLRNALLIERDALVAERAAWLVERSGLIEEGAALRHSLEAAEARLNRLRSSPIGLAYRAFRRWIPRRSGIDRPNR